LQSLLNWKESLEEESRMTLAGKNRQLRRQEGEIRELAGQREENDRGLRQRMGKGILAQEYMMHKQFNEESYQDLAQKKLNKKQMEQEIEGERERLTGRMKERKILERLKEKRFKTFLNELEKLEQKNLDEVAIGTYQKRVRFGGHSEGDY